MLAIKQLTNQDLDLVDDFVQQQLKAIPKELFSTLDRLLIAKALNSNFCYAAWADNQLIAVSLAYIPGIGQNNYGHDLGYSEAQLSKVAQLIGTIVMPND
jgi:uncharacterized protein YecE (DUF72 family)